jgi:hypothetical protein
MDVRTATADVLLGASLAQIAAAYREELIRDFGFRPDEITAETFRSEVAAFMRKLARHLGDRHSGEPRVGQALQQWVLRCEHYEAWDALLTGFAVDGRATLLRRGRLLFPGPLTAHWGEAE